MTRLVLASFVLALLAVPAVSSAAIGATPTCGGLKATIEGTSGNDLLIGTKRRDVIVAGAGHDKVLARGGNDVICGGAGRDVLNGEAGADTIRGGDGNDTLKGAAGFDRLNGGAGKDACYPGEDGAAQLACEPADLRVRISAPDSVVSGADFSYTVNVRNIGAKRSSSFQLDIVEVDSDVICGLDLSTDMSVDALAPGHFFAWTITHDDDCAIVTGSDPRLHIDADIDPASPDGDAGNNSASTSIDFTLP